MQRDDEQTKPLGHFLEHGVSVIPTYANGPTSGSWKDRRNYSRDRNHVAHWWRGGFRRFQFLPADNGILSLDVDRKHGKDGLSALRHAFLNAGKAAPSYLSDPSQHPAVTETPGGGLHLHFNYRGTRRYRSGAIARGLEAIHSGHLLTAPGSEKEGKRYRFYGDLAAAPEAPTTLLRMLTDITEPQPTPAPAAWTYHHPQHGSYSLDDIAEIIDRQGRANRQPGSRHLWEVEFIPFARKVGYSAADVISYLRTIFEASDHTATEIEHTVNSFY